MWGAKSDERGRTETQRGAARSDGNKGGTQQGVRRDVSGWGGSQLCRWCHGGAATDEHFAALQPRVSLRFVRLSLPALPQWITSAWPSPGRKLTPIPCHVNKPAAATVHQSKPRSGLFKASTPTPTANRSPGFNIRLVGKLVSEGLYAHLCFFKDAVRVLLTSGFCQGSSTN